MYPQWKQQEHHVKAQQWPSNLIYDWMNSCLTQKWNSIICTNRLMNSISLYVQVLPLLGPPPPPVRAHAAFFCVSPYNLSIVRQSWLLDSFILFWASQCIMSEAGTPSMARMTSPGHKLAAEALLPGVIWTGRRRRKTAAVTYQWHDTDSWWITVFYKNGTVHHKRHLKPGS